MGRHDRFTGLPGWALTLTRYRPVRDVFEESDQRGSARALTLTVGLEGASGFRSRDGGALSFRRGFTTVAASGGTVGDRCFGAGTAVSQLRLSVEESELARYLGAERCAALLGRGGMQQIALQPTSAACTTHALALARRARGAQPEGDVLGLHLHMMGLLAEELRRLLPQSSREGPRQRLRDEEIERIERAREQMAQALDKPLSLAWLAQAVGLGEHRLRRGFQMRYGMSPQRMLQSLRMEHARVLLEQGCQVAVAAYRCGYAHPANFSAAFKKHFGRPPGAGGGSA